MNRIFRVSECVFGVLYTNKGSMINDAALSMTVKRSLTSRQKESLDEGLSYNLRGLNTYNLIKRVIWSSATYRPTGELDEKSEINLPLLKGLLNEIQMELYIEDYLHRSGMRRNDGSYKEIDIYEEKGFDNYAECDEHPSIREVLSQFSMIDPYKILKTFHVTEPMPVLSKKTKRGNQSSKTSST